MLQVLMATIVALCSVWNLIAFTDPFSGSEKIPTMETRAGQQSATVTKDTVCTPLSEKQPCLDEEKNASRADWEDEPSSRQSDRKRRRSSVGSTPESGTDPHFGHKVC